MRGGRPEQPSSPQGSEAVAAIERDGCESERDVRTAVTVCAFRIGAASPVVMSRAECLHLDCRKRE